MTAKWVEGHGLADIRLTAVRAEIERRGDAGLPAPVLAVIVAAGDPGAAAYAQRQADFARQVGIRIEMHGLAPEATTDEAMALVAALNADPQVDAILPLFPFPPEIDAERMARAIDPDKDVDGLTPVNAGRTALGEGGFTPCTAVGAMALAETMKSDFKGATVTVVGASPRVGRPLAQLLLQREATVTIAHAATRDLAAACRHAEVVFVAAGRPGLITGAHLAPGALVIDIGINRVNGAIVGDVDAASAGEVAGAITVAPDGVGPVTTAVLMAHTLRSAQTARPLG